MLTNGVRICVLVTCFAVGINCDFVYPEGGSCQHEGLNGTCVYWYRCLSLVADLEEQKMPPMCSDGPDPVICCTSCELIDHIKRVVINRIDGGVLIKTNQTSWNKCMDFYFNLPYSCSAGSGGSVMKLFNYTHQCFELGATATLASGGRDAERGEYPHMALLGYGPSVTNAEWLCGGTILNQRYILTAGHCIGSSSLGYVKYAVLGILRRSDPVYMWQTYNIVQIIPHPQFSPPSKYHDIALLKTDRDVMFSQLVLPACLPNLADRPSAEVAHATGWGATHYRSGVADTMQTVKLRKLNHTRCGARYRSLRFLDQGFDSKTQLCYGDVIGTGDTCSGDSGGPLQVYDTIGPCLPTVVGVTSFGAPCGLGRSAGVYTRVERYVPWIDDVIWA